jgi:hypothetical protein
MIKFLNQVGMEDAERSKLSEANKRGQREAVTRAKGKSESMRRKELLSSFKEKEQVTDGKRVGHITRLDTLRGELVVRLRSGKEIRLSPEFARKIP